MSAAGVDCVTSVCVNGSSDYLPRVRRIIACMADSVGMDSQESAAAEMLVSELCADAMQGVAQQPGQAFSLTLRALDDAIVADLPISDETAIPVPCSTSAPSLADRLKKIISEGVQFISHRAGLTVKLTRRSRATRRPLTGRLSAHHRN